MKADQLPQHGIVVLGRSCFIAGDPGVELGIRYFDQPLEMVERRLVEFVDIDIGETTDDQVHFAHTAPSCEKHKLWPPHIQPFARSFRHDGLLSEHDLFRKTGSRLSGSCSKRRKPGRGRATGYQESRA